MECDWKNLVNEPKLQLAKALIPGFRYLHQVLGHPIHSSRCQIYTSMSNLQTKLGNTQMLVTHSLHKYYQNINLMSLQIFLVAFLFIQLLH